MKRIEFLIWVGKQGLKIKGLQTYLNKAWQEATKGGKQILKSQFPKLLNKAKEYYGGFKRAGLKSVNKPKRFEWEPQKNFDARLRAIVDKHKAKIKAEQLHAANTERFVKGAKEGITGIKKPGFHPFVIKGGKKADGGRIDKALSTRSRDI